MGDEGSKGLPPGQRAVSVPREVNLGARPRFDPASWRLSITGLVHNSVSLTWEDFVRLPTTRVEADLHCVEGWSLVGLVWEGPRLREVVELAAPKPEAQFVYFSCADGYSTSLPLVLASADNVIIARLRNGKPIPDIEGGPVQLVVPDRYAYKWARWLREIELLAEDRLGYWELRGYSNTADVWRNDRRRVET